MMPVDIAPDLASCCRLRHAALAPVARYHLTWIPEG
jgi:hypothetical protein